MALAVHDPSDERSRERAILFFTCTAHALAHIYTLIHPSVLLAMAASFALNQEEFLRYATIGSVLFGVGALPAGWLSDRLGEKTLLVAFFFLTAAGGSVLGAADSHRALAIGFALLGTGASIFHPVGNAMISKGIRVPGKAMGINGLWGSLGTALAPILAYQIAAWSDWRWIYLSLAVPTVLLGISLMRTAIPITTRPSTAPDKMEHGSQPAPAPPTGSSPPSNWFWIITLLLGATSLGGFYFFLVTTILPSHFEAHIHFSADTQSRAAAYGIGVCYAVGGAGQVIAGNLMQRYEGRGLYAAVLACAAPLIFWVGSSEDVTLLGATAFMATFIFAAQPVENVLLARYSPARYRGLIFGSKFILAFGLGGLGTWVAGLITEEYSTRAVFTVASAVTAGSALLILLALVLPRWWKQPRQAQS